MKKLLGLLGAATLVATPTLAVVSCESNANYTTFKSWIDNKESFVLYISADDCEHCQDFDKALGLPGGEDEFKAQLNRVNQSWVNDATGLGSNDSASQAVGWSKVDTVDYHSFKYDNYSNIWNDTKSMKNIRNWVVDQYIELIKTELSNMDLENNKYWNDDDRVNDALEQLISGNGTPIFLLVRHGKFVGVYSGFTPADNASIDDFVTVANAIGDIWSNENQALDLANAGYDAIMNYTKPSDDEDSDDTDTDTDTEKLAMNYDNVDLNSYL